MKSYLTIAVLVLGCEAGSDGDAGAPCPVGTECAMVDLEGTFGCVEVVDAGTDAGP